ncbi:MAG: efflux RND transporter periplasmic adaptor subunit [Chromatiales bacterium]|nr:efflux RND transporter periplasmic adaptor subunit [Chromatiales bacterium]
MRPTYLLPLLLALFVSASWAAKDDKPVPVIAAQVQTERLADRVEALGTLKANESVTLTANVTETVSAIRFDDGQRVKKGQVLVEMTNAEEQALLAEARARLAEAQRQYDRVKALEAQRSVSQSLVDERKRDLDTGRANLVAIESRLADRLIKAPFAGLLGLRNISPGALVEPGDLITTLDDDTVMKLDFAVPSLFLPDLKPGLAIHAKARAYGERTFDGEIRSIDSRVDPVTRSILVRALIPNPDLSLKPGVLMQVELLRNPRDGLVVPEEALLQQGRQHFVIRVGEGEVAEKRQVKIGMRRPGMVEIVSGLALGDRVVIEGNDKVRPSQKLKVRLIDEATVEPQS